MPEFWETAFSTNRTMWGDTPVDNARTVLHLFQEHGIQTMLVPGFGYGRNAKVFYEQGISVTGIEISETAIARAREHFDNSIVLHHGSVADMPFDNARFDGVYCYSLLHLLSPPDRSKLIDACYQQLKPGGLMVFVALSVNDNRYGAGEEIAPNTFLSPHGLPLYFYNEAAIDGEFGNYGILEAKEINEPKENPNERMWMVVCRKQVCPIP